MFANLRNQLTLCFICVFRVISRLWRRKDEHESTTVSHNLKHWFYKQWEKM